MNSSTRRTFIMTLVAGSGALAASAARAQQALSTTDPQAVALGYTTDTKTVDAKKYPNHAASQDCGNCMHYQGKPDADTGPCQIFGGKLVHRQGWCAAWVKKA